MNKHHIHLINIDPPVPDSGEAWAAYYDSDDGNDLIGFGMTPSEALQALLTQGDAT